MGDVRCAASWTNRVRDKARVVTNENENENNAAAYSRTLVASVEHYETIVLKELRDI